MFNNTTITTPTGNYVLIRQRPISTSKSYGNTFVADSSPAAYELDMKTEFSIPTPGKRERKLIQCNLSSAVMDPLKPNDDVIVNITVSHMGDTDENKIVEAVAVAIDSLGLAGITNKIVKGISS